MKFWDMGRIRNGILRELEAAIETGVSLKTENFPNASVAYISKAESWVLAVADAVCGSARGVEEEWNLKISDKF